MKKLLISALLLCLSFAAEAQRVPEWLKDGVIYHIYPSSFKDSNADGIGDVNGIRSKLDYVKSLGANTIWLSPVFKSEFMDGGYDITDFYAVDPRFGTNTELTELIQEAHAKGLRVLLDLVIGHTSDKHPWFLQSRQAEKNQQYSDYFIWTESRDDAPSKKFIRSDAPRQGNYLKNYFDCQPALNFGYANPDPSKPWQQATNAPGPMAVRNEVKNIISFWMDKGADGFRCDMAASLVKNDDKQHTATKELWHDIRSWYEQKYPAGILVSEWSRPREALNAGFHIDLIIHNGAGKEIYQPLILNTTSDCSQPVVCYFDRAAKGEIRSFAENFETEFRATRDLGYAAMPTCSHDIWRLRRGSRTTTEEQKVLLMFFTTLPNVPIIYYGEEIAMRNQDNAPIKEGSKSSRNRSSCRTPMQWDATANAGFSAAAPEKLYLPIDPQSDRPTVAAQQDDPTSVLNFYRGLLKVRAAHPALGARGDWHFVSNPDQPYPMVYLRELDGRKFLVAINPGGRTATAEFAAPAQSAKTIYGTADKVARYTLRKAQAQLRMAPVSAAILELE